ncbi:unnamed protein product [Kluyveromyces dobzhanskii CBS 2104]|uniref:1-phosphatidylinositol-3-phosphate 5-kinase n=1 Tax=Kluyveromyces dobzhanskii CBS 2104 TaxID=1427455 RepID=A0A0A8L422_9SACH|nr:unnamed protein product [Kluyveromyces dobzhanskii CBS 2104]
MPQSVRDTGSMTDTAENSESDAGKNDNRISSSNTTGNNRAEVPEFINQKPLLSRTTTGVDTNPVLSDMQVSVPAGLDLMNEEQRSANGNDVQESTTRQNNALQMPNIRRKSGVNGVQHNSLQRALSNDSSTDYDIPSKTDSENPSVGKGEHPKALHFSLGNSARTKRSSIYESKSTVTAIPIRTPSNSNRNLHGYSHQHSYTDRDDVVSMKSVSSSLTASFSRSFLFGFYDKKEQGKQKKKNILSKEYWMKDESAKECFNCAKLFTTFRRKHHCRICGQIFCSSCSFLIPGESFGYRGRMRICGKCYEHSMNYEDSSEEESDEEIFHDQTSSRNLEEEAPSLNNDDIQSILSNVDDHKVHLSTPEPLPRMAIPATKQGESLEISFHNKANNHSYRKNRPRRGTQDRYTLHNVDMLSPIPQELSDSRHSPERPLLVSSNNQLGNMRQSFSSYLGQKNNNNTLRQDPTNNPNVLKTLANKNFKFEFNYDMKNFQSFLNKERQPLGIHEQKQIPHLSNHYSSPNFQNGFESSDEGSEDEASMSLYTSLNDTHKQDKNRSLTMRNSTNSTQRAQASLQRMRQRRKSKSRTGAVANNGRGEFSFLNSSAPNLVTVLNNNDLVFSKNQSIPPQKQKYDSNSKDVRKSTLNPSSWRRISMEKKEELNDVCKLHLEALLQQALEDQEIPGEEEWTEIFKTMITQIQGITLDARKAGDLDFKQQHVKIKRLPGGNVLDSMILSGVLYSKGLPLKTMPRVVLNPRILLIMFPLEYQKHNNHVISIESVVAQEKEYLKKLVLRLQSLNPDIILTGTSASGYALQLFQDAGIVVQCHVKPQVIERISRVTGCDIVITMDKLSSNVKLGTCEKFEVRTYIYGNLSKNYTFITGCKTQAGITLVLRGNTFEILRKVKDVAEFVAYAVFSMKLESSFFNDNFLQPNVEAYKQIQLTKRKDMDFTGFFADFIKKFNKRILSVSPIVEFPIPFLLQKARNVEQKLLDKTALLKKLQHSSDILKYKDSIDLSEMQLETALTQRDFEYLIQFVNSKEYDELKLEFGRLKKQWEIYSSLSHNMLGTGPHQNISVLYSVISRKTTTPCIGPEIVTIDYFWENDISIGQFIENVVATAFRTCGDGCGGLMIDHYRSYAHGNGKLDVIIEKLQSKMPMLKNLILTWSYCKRCGLSSPTLQLSEKSWNYSLGKYLELMFWSSPKNINSIGNCSHDVAKDHLKYFSLNDLVIRMEYSDIDVHELITPSATITWNPGKDIKLKVELYYQILEKIDAFYGSVLERLNKLIIDTISDSKLGDAKERITQLKKLVDEEKSTLVTNIETIYTGSEGDQHLQLNSIIRGLHDNAAGWDNEFVEFENEFLPTEKDISRITAVQLKKMFTDSNKIAEGNELKETDYEDLDTDEKKVISTETADKEEELIETSEHLPQRPLLSQSAKFLLSRSSNSVPTAEELERFGSQRKLSFASTTDVNHLRKLSENSSNSIHSQSTKDKNADTKVGQLANFFDQIHFDSVTKEFELQREMERLNINKTKYQAMRAKSLKPIVEIYKNVQDAVEEPINVDKGAKNQVRLTKSNSNQGSSENARPLNKGLENELEQSINQWSKRVLQNQKGNQSNDKTTKPSTEPLPPVTTITNANKDGTKLAVENIVAPSQKSSLLTTLANFWADRSASFWKPLSYPTSPTEHIFMDNDVIIREDEPSSLIAFCLSSNDYQRKVNEMLRNVRKPPGSFDSQNVKPDLNTLKTESMETRLEIDTHESFLKPSNTDLEMIMTKKTGMHLRYQFQDGNTIMSCKMFFFEQFDAFRKKCGCGEENFIQSLSRCVKWDSSGGKSGSAFLKTLDDRFVIKELSHSELDAFINFSSSYFEYMSQALFHDLPTALAKILGFYQIQIRNSATVKSFKMDVIIMENVFYKRKSTRIFDLKGSMRNRHVEQTGKENEVLLDENMVEYIYESPIFVREYDKKLLRASLWNDTLFLAKMNVMDYSLVIGVDSETHSLSVGIIDCIRTFTWDKKLESWVKEKGLVGGSTKEPTVVTPRQYKNRFREAMDRYILMVPDPWYQDTEA